MKLRLEGVTDSSESSDRSVIGRDNYLSSTDSDVKFYEQLFIRMRLGYDGALSIYESGGDYSLAESCLTDVEDDHSFLLTTHVRQRREEMRSDQHQQGRTGTGTGDVNKETLITKEDATCMAL